MTTPANKPFDAESRPRLRIEISGPQGCGKTAALVVAKSAIELALPDLKFDIFETLTRDLIPRKDVDALIVAFKVAIERLVDMEKGDDAQSWKECRKALPMLNKSLSEFQQKHGGRND